MWQTRDGCPARPHVDGLAFIPQVWGGYGLNQTAHPGALNTTLLQGADYLLAWNEPDMYGQAWIHPRDGARLWPFFLQLQKQYKFKLVAPCVSNAGGAKWWLDAWWGNCTAMHGPEGCPFDFACTHAYFYPETAPGKGCDGLPDWVCASTMMDMIEGLSKRFGGKQVWVTEWACPDWVKNTKPTGHECTVAKQIALMNQTMPRMDASPIVHRYSWYENLDIKFGTNSLLTKDGSALTELGRWYNEH
jgi:hypothetical protein